MGIDHGLGGKDNAKSREKREKRAARQAHKARSSITIVKNKKEVIFNEEDRTKWLTGFRQRKTERRKYGLAMQIVKEKAAHKEVLKVKRKQTKEARGELPSEQVPYDKNNKNIATQKEKSKDSADAAATASDNDSESDSDNDNENKTKTEKTISFDDAGTIGMFGAGVSVSVGIGIGDEDIDNDPFNDPELAAGLERYKAKTALQRKPLLSKLEKAVKKVQQSGALSSKSKKGGSKRHADGEAPARVTYGKHGKKQVVKSKIQGRATAANAMLSKVKGGGSGNSSFKGRSSGSGKGKGGKR